MKETLALLLALAVLAAACGSGDDTEAVVSGDSQPAATSAPDGEPEAQPQAETDPEAAPDPTSTPVPDEPQVPESFPVTVAHGTGEITFATPPERIVSLSPVATEMLFAIGAGGQVIAVDDQSNYPADAPTTDLSGFTPNVEAIIGFEPDLVVSQGLPEDIEAGLASAGIPSMTLFFGAVLDDTYNQLEILGAATGHVGDAAQLVGDIQGDLEAIAAETEVSAEPITYYHELDNTLFSATSSTFIGQIYALVGLVNIADAADADGFGFPQLSVEYILEQDPDLIFLADTKCCGENVETAAARPGWNQLTAVKTGNVIELDDDIASRWGPRIVDFLRVVVDATSDAALVAAG